MVYLLVVLFLLLSVIVFLVVQILLLKKRSGLTGGDYNEEIMESLVNPPDNIPWLMRLMIGIADKKARKRMLPGRVLAWSFKISLSAGLLEVLTERGAAECLDKRLITLLRMIVSYSVPSGFTIDINAQAYRQFNITAEEIDGIRGVKNIDEIASFSDREKVMLKYANALTQTPLILTKELLNDLRRVFSEKEIVAIAALTAKVNYWSRFIEGVRIKPAGYSNDPVLHLDEYVTLKKADAKKKKVL